MSDSDGDEIVYVSRQRRPATPPPAASDASPSGGRTGRFTSEEDRLICKSFSTAILKHHKGDLLQQDRDGDRDGEDERRVNQLAFDLYTDECTAKGIRKRRDPAAICQRFCSDIMPAVFAFDKIENDFICKVDPSPDKRGGDRKDKRHLELGDDELYEECNRVCT